MKLPLLLLSLAGTLLIVSCAHHQTLDTAGTDDQHQQDALFLLVELCQQNAEVDKLMLVKSPGKDVEKHAKDISLAFKKLHTDLKAMQVKPPSPSPLPTAEIQTRKRIKSTQTHRLLSEENQTFRTNFLLTQISALDYASHLLQYVIDLSQESDQGHRLQPHQAKLDQLYQITRKMIASP